MPSNYVSDPNAISEELLGVDSLEELEDMSPQEIEELKEEARNAALKKENALSDLGLMMESMFSKFSKNRSSKEEEWTSALLQYNQNYTQYKEKGKMPSRNTKRKKPGVNITRARTNIAIERLQDIQFPLGGDYNFHIDAIHDPD